MAVTALLDSGATGLFIDADFAQSKNLTTTRLPRSIPVYNIDGSLNHHGSVKETVDLILRYKDHTERATFYVTALGGVPVILGHPWLSQHNPQIDWTTGEVSMTRCPSDCRMHHIRAQRKRRDRARLTKKALQEEKPIEEKARSSVEELIEEEAQPTVEEPRYPILEEGDRIMRVVFPSVQIRASSTVSQRLAEASNKYRITQSFQETVPHHYHRFEQVFLKESFDELPTQKKWDHVIELIPGSKEFGTKLYPMSPSEQVELDKFLDENLKSGRIRPSKSPMASPVFFIKKKDGSLRFVQDYRKLNEITIRNRYPLPLIPDIMSRVTGAKFFTKLDVRWGYNNIRIREGDEWKAAFRTNRGMFEPLVMFFGLCNSPATFQTMMNDIFRRLIEEGVVAVYMDDILIFTKTLREHREVVSRVLQILKDNNLYLKPEKCIFEAQKIEFLGLILSENQIEMDPVKIEGVREWPKPNKVRELQSFLGFINFYRRFIEDFSKVARPLHDLTRKDSEWKWEDIHQKAFEDLKHRITSAPILVQPDVSKPFKLETDASDFATGAVLSQLCEDEKWRPVGFLSKSLSEAERNYQVYDKELLSVIRALEEWRHLLEGAAHQVEIYNDHRNLTYFMNAQNLNRRQARWSLYLSRFNFLMHHRPGKSSGKPDALSRRVDHQQDEPDNLGQTLLTPEFFAVQAAGGVALSMEGEEFVDRIRNCKNQDEAVVKAFRSLKSTSGLVKNEEWHEENGLITYNGRLYVPQDKKLRHDIVHTHHDTAMAGHPGRWKTQELVLRNYWWPGISRFISHYVKSCDKCNRAKIYPSAPVGRLAPNSIPDRCWQVVTTDLITGLPESHGFDAIWVTVDRLSKRIHVAPTTGEVDSLGIARLFRDHVWRNHGLPDQIISDRGSQFVSGFTRELNRLLGIKTSLSTAFHPETDGQTERVNSEIEQYLRIFINQRQDDWAEWIPLAEFAYNNRVHASTRHTPFELDSGQHPRMGIEPGLSTKREATEVFTNRIKKATEEARSALQQAAEDMARFHNAHRGKKVTFKVGEKVWLDSRNIKTKRPSKKLDDRWFGPFLIDEVISDNAYKLKLTPAFSRIHPVFNVTLLRKYVPDEISHRPQPSHPDPHIDEEGEEAYEVESILDSRFHRGHLEYLVSWKGYGPEDNLWIPERNVKFAQRLVSKYHQEHPNAPRRISALVWQQLPFQRYMQPPSTKPQLFNWHSGKLVETPSLKRGVI
jgi:transposase InsO family protein